MVTPVVLVKRVIGVARADIFNGIKHIKGITYWPPSNSEVENHNQTLLKAIRVDRVTGGNSSGAGKTCYRCGKS